MVSARPSGPKSRVTRKTIRKEQPDTRSSMPDTRSSMIEFIVSQRFPGARNVLWDIEDSINDLDEDDPAYQEAIVKSVRAAAEGRWPQDSDVSEEEREKHHEAILLATELWEMR